MGWNQWFAPFFTFIHAHAEVKAFCYIDWNWSQYPQWQGWGDARLEQNAIVSNQFAGEMDSVQYLHASTESAFRKTFGLSDITAPETPGTISVVQATYPLQLGWDAVTDPSGLSHYILYKNGILLDYTLTLHYSDKNVASGELITYAVSAMDRAGNESQKTPDLKVSVPSTLSKALNGEFDNGTQNWQLSMYASGTAATMKIDANSVLSGVISCEVNLTQVTGTGWHIQLWQPLTIYQGRKYTFTFKAKASSTKVIHLELQKATSPYTIYLDKVHTLTTAVQTFTDEVSITTTDQAKLEFFLGSSGTVQVWIDAVSIVESSSTSGIDEQTGMAANLYLQQNYPNPFHSGTTIMYKVTEPGFVSLKVFDAMGIEVASLVNEQKPAGDYSVEWNTVTGDSGIYFCKLQNGSCFEVKKMLLLK